MKRRSRLRSNTEKARAWERRRGKLQKKKRLKAKAKLRRQKAIPKVNHARIKRLRMEKFGDDGKREWVMSMECCVTNSYGSDEWPVDPAHVGKSRAAGGGPEMLAPLRRDVHSDFDSLPESKFEDKYGVSKLWVRQHAEALEREWQRLTTEAQA